MEDWKLATDRLRCSSNFFGKPRYDYIIFKADESGTMKYGRLKEVFIVPTADLEKKYPIAFIDVLEVPHGSRSHVDSDLGLCRLRKVQDRNRSTMFIHVRSIVRGALVVRDHGSVGTSRAHEDYFAIDIIDGDMFLRCQKYFPHWYA